MLKRFKPLEYKFRTKLACEISGIDPQRLNEAIAARDGYTCAPKTSAGVAREFGEFDLISLWLFRFLSGHGYSQSLASMYACGVLNSLNHNYHKLPERFDFPLMPFPGEVVACQLDEPTTFSLSEDSISLVTIGFNVTHLRKMIQERMEKVAKRERNTFGED